MGLSKIDQSISVIRFLLKKKKKRVEDMGRKVEVREQEKIFMGQELELIQNTEALIEAFLKEANRNFGKLPPQATELEDSVLGSCILEAHSYGKVQSFLKVAHFYLEKNKLIFSAIVALFDAVNPIDMNTVIAQLRRTGHLEVVGGSYEIATLTSKVSQSYNVEFHSRILIEMAIKRELISMAAQIIGDGYEDTTDCFDLLDYAKGKTKEIEAWIK